MAKRAKFDRKAQAARVGAILRALDEVYPDATCALEHRNAFELLIATILSAQCTDERVNIVTHDLFRKYPGPREMAAVPQEVLEQEIRSTGFFRNKAKNVHGACEMILKKFGGRVPDSMGELIQLPGVARKTANVVLGVVFGKAEGVVVDTHVFRLSHRLELTDADTPERVEADLMNLVPQDRWIRFSHQMILHGRRICQARKPMCGQCPVESVCRSGDKMLAAAPARRRAGPGRIKGRT